MSYGGYYGPSNEDNRGPNLRMVAGIILAVISIAIYSFRPKSTR